MAVTYGFYNALNHDRLYDAIQMSSIFDGIIRDGIFSTIGDTMIVTSPEDGMYVNVGSGRAWFNHTWTLNDTAYPIEAEEAEVVLDRIDAVILEVNSSAEVRANSIKFLKGTPSSNPVKPTLTHNAEVNQYALAYVRIRAGQTTILQSDIENAVGTNETPFITGVLQQVSIENLLKQWEAEFNTYFTNFQNTSTTEFNTYFTNFQNTSTTEFNNWLATKVSEYTAWFAQMQTDMDSNFNEFDAWFQRMKDQLSEDAAGHLQAEIDVLSESAKKGSIITVTTTEPTLFGKNVTISKDGFDPVISSFNDSGVAYFETVPMVGDVSIEATNGTITAHESLNIPYFGRYNTTLEFWEAILDISANSTTLYNRQITVKKNSSTVGMTTFDSTGHATFSVHSVGTYNISATDSLSTTYEVDVDVTEETTYIVELGSEIDGTVKPTDNIATWLKCANIEDPSITTLADVLANRSLFETLIANSNACNYMARSTTWSISNAGIVNSQDAMSLIGKYDYCSNALLSNATWADAICNSEYFEEVLNVKVPTMTSNTTPSGEVIKSSENSNNPAWNVFNGYDGAWHTSNKASTFSNIYVGYKFVNPINVRRYVIKSGDKAQTVKYKIQGSNDATTWIDLTAENTVVNDYSVDETIDNNSYYLYYRMLITSQKFTVNKFGGIVNELQFYGRSSVQTNIIHSAANDTIYMMKDGSQVVLTTTDSDGVGILDFTQFDDGITYTLYSSVAKDPNNLSNYYSKDIRITKSKYGCTTEAYIMPDTVKTLYWYGYEYNYEGIGIAINPDNNRTSITKNVNYIQITGYASSSVMYTKEKQSVNTNTKIKAIYNFDNEDVYGYTTIYVGSSNNYNVGEYNKVPEMVDEEAASNFNVGKKIITCNSTNNGQYYIRIDVNVANPKTSKTEVYSLWLE